MLFRVFTAIFLPFRSFAALTGLPFFTTTEKGEWSLLSYALSLNTLILRPCAFERMVET